MIKRLRVEKTFPAAVFCGAVQFIFLLPPDNESRQAARLESVMKNEDAEMFGVCRKSTFKSAPALAAQHESGTYNTFFFSSKLGRLNLYKARAVWLI